MILELDLGNSRAKWRIVNDAAEVVEQDAADIADWLEGSFPEIWRSDIERVRLVSVLSPIAEKKIISKISTELSVAPEIAISTTNCCGVVNAYIHPERLGTDRWLVLIAAYKRYQKAVMVIDLGTALKVDIVNDAGLHVGGYIIPGAVLMEQALLIGTDRVRYESGQRVERVTFGKDTRSCVQHGIAAAIVGAVLIAIEECQSLLGKRPYLLITGGLGFSLLERLQEKGIHEIKFEADLVLDGLKWVLP